MSNNVIDIRSRQPHLSGKALCLNCNYSWVATAEVGTTSLECPECKTAQGVFDGICAPEQFWECRCTCRHFFVTQKSAVCCHCGLEQVFP